MENKTVIVELRRKINGEYKTVFEKEMEANEFELVKDTLRSFQSFYLDEIDKIKNLCDLPALMVPYENAAKEYAKQFFDLAIEKAYELNSDDPILTANELLEIKEMI